MKEPRRYLLGLEPFFEGGWLHKGKRGRSWDVENEVLAISLFGDVTIDLSNVKSLPPVIQIRAYAIRRDVDIIVPWGTEVELVGRANNHLLSDGAPPVSIPDRTHSVKISGHTFLGDVTTREAVGPR
jgi:hypothetical protein